MRTGTVRDPLTTVATAIAFVTLFAATFPLFVTAITAFNATTETVFPPNGWSLRWFWNIAAQPELIEAAGFSLVLAIISSVISISLGVVSAIALTRKKFPGRDMIDAVLMSPLLVPQVIMGLSFLVFFVRIGSKQPFLNLLILHVVLTFPYALRIIRSSLMRMNPKLEEAAVGLGASNIKSFFLVTFPQMRPSLFVAIFFCFVVSFDNFTASAFLTVSGATLPVQIYFNIESSLDPTISAISALLIVSSATFVIVADRVVGVEKIV